MANENKHESEGGAPNALSISDERTKDARREALKRMGRYAAYTAPALLALLTSTQAAAAS